MRDLPPEAHRQFGVFTAGQAYTADWTPSALKHAVACGELRRCRHGVYAVPPDRRRPDCRHVEATQTTVAASLTYREATVSHASAARMWRMPVIAREPLSCITVPTGGIRHAARVHVHRALLPASHRRNLADLTVTSPARTIVDCARELGTEAALVMADAAMRAGRLSSSELVQMIAACRRMPFVRRAADIVDLVDPCAESALESRSRWQIRGAGLPPPRTQVVILDRWGRFIARVDFYWDEFGVVGEADGEAKQQSLQALRAQHDRERDLRDLGLPVVRWGWRDLDPFDGVAGRLENAFEHGTPPGPDRRWQVALTMPR